MARRATKRPLRPRKPARVKKRTQRKSAPQPPPSRADRARPARGRALPRLAALPRLGRRRRRPRRSSTGSTSVIGDLTLPAADRPRRLRRCCSSRAPQLLDMRPFRTGSTIVMLGLFLVLGPSAGLIGPGLDAMVGRFIGRPAASCSASPRPSPASCCSPAPRSAPSCAARTTSSAARQRARKATRAHARDGTRPRPGCPRSPPCTSRRSTRPPPSRTSIGEPELARARAQLELTPDEPDELSVRGRPAVNQVSTASTACPDRALLRRSPPGHRRHGRCERPGRRRRSSRRSATSASRPVVVGQISGPRVTRYELQLAPGTKMSKVSALKDDLSYALATTEIRILAPIPGKQAVGVEVPNLSPNLVTLGDIFGDVPQTASPVSRLARQGHLRQRRLDRPRAHAAPPDRRHHRLGQVGLHQHDPDVDPAALDARRGAPDPDRPEADRARLLRVDPAPAHAGRLEPEGGRGGAHQRRRRDGAAATSASPPSARATCPRRTARSASAGRSRCRTCSS